MANHTPNTQHGSDRPRFSAGLVTTIFTVFWLVVFGLAIMHGLDGINQHAEVVSTQSSK